MNNMVDFAFPYLLQFIREYSSKVGDLVKDKIESQNEERAKEKEGERPCCPAEHARSIASSCVARATYAWHGRSSTSHGWNGHASNGRNGYAADGTWSDAGVWDATSGKLLDLIFWRF
ncbi:hypothetical protein PVAP13_3NG298303 [Panicum virgatum]|uniref:Uncharacterized protein n=1 Tax=Panicum virgatum TaxID=38727 RepID=A0A8T0UH97_PANVG|nr:hypothetical protein PVAP13_3NG298303 [Panicum virgatum]